MSLNFSFLNNNKRAVILFHGLTGSPFEVKKYGKFLSDNGFDVYAECLPGHGDYEEDIYVTTYEQWIDFASRQFENIYQKYDEVYLAGICLGAVISLALAEKYPDKIKSVAAFSTTLFLDGWRLPWYSCFMPIALHTILRYYYTYPECEPHGIKNMKTRKAIKLLLEKGEVSMDNFPMSAIYELLKLSKEVRSNLKSVKTPVLLVHSKDDDLTSPKSANVVYENISSEKKEFVILNDSYHMVLYDNEKEFVFNKSLEFFNKVSNVNVEELQAC